MIIKTAITYNTKCHVKSTIHEIPRNQNPRSTILDKLFVFEYLVAIAGSS